MTKHKQTQKNIKMRSRQSQPTGRGPRSWQPQRPTRTVSPSPPRAKLRFARGTQRRTNDTPPRSRVGRPLERDSASLEGQTPPRVRLRLARGLDTPSGETPPRSRLSRARRFHTHSLAEAFNVLTHVGAQVKDESSPCRPSDAAWESYPDTVSPTLPVRPSPPLYDTVR
jgi:hypothetical protein